MSAAVEQATQAHLIVSTHHSAPLAVKLRYRPEDPLAVRMVFPAEYALDGAEPDPAAPATGDLPSPQAPPEVEWVFARQLLAAGLDLPSGVGDVHVRPAPGQHTMVELRAPEGIALLRFDSGDLRRFLWHSYVSVPEDEELHHLDPDRALAELLG
ncbi:SsgA family sporulation/cell division regulator [Kitasatospora sp. NPDC056138]|uniref:SsgA family sporulation/cell division regulator n=1 Tax=Kitasatospora sp. NPDC056138 TaxID=3345724 RepID=UPI0035E288AD